MILSDGGIRRARSRGELAIVPFAESQLQPASYDLCIAQSLIVNPGDFVLASTVERICLSASICANLSGKSSWGRLGLWVENAGFVDPGFDGELTLEVFNGGKAPIRVLAGQAIVQIQFSVLDSPCERPYSAVRNHYMGQRGPTESRFVAEQYNVRHHLKLVTRSGDKP